MGEQTKGGYGLLLCLATQRARDLPEGVVSHVGTFLVHRVATDRDRDLLERAGSDLERAVGTADNAEPGFGRAPTSLDQFQRSGWAGLNRGVSWRSAKGAVKDDLRQGALENRELMVVQFRDE